MRKGTEAIETNAFARWALFAVVLIYLGAASALLIRARGIPYGLDGNETFSDSVHARNLNSFAWNNAFGLTDESYGDSAASHPYIHSHQGNFPRLYTYFLYDLGARTPEKQVVATVFTVGLMGILLAFRFFARLVNPLFAALVCLVYISDYFLFGQWHLNTYRVWHCFFFFSSLLCAVNFAGKPTRASGLLALINFTCLCYWEFAFASFVLMTAAGYVVLATPKNPRRIAAFWGLELLGSVLAAGIFLGQLSAYMGFDAVRQDLSYILHARNSAEEHSFTTEITSFYAQHKVLYWPNYMDASKLRNVPSFVDSLLRHHLQYYTPWLALAMLFTAAGWLLALLSERALSHLFSARIIVVLTWLYAIWWCFSKENVWFNWDELPLWQAAGWANGWFDLLLFSGIFVIVVSLIIIKPSRIMGVDRSEAVWGIFGLFIAGIFGYICSYTAFTGYVYSGYLNRHAPFLVFLSDTLLALVLYSFAAPLAAFHSFYARNNPIKVVASRTARVFATAGCFGVLTILVVGWLRLQYEYMQVAPIDGFAFIKRLSKAPYRGHSFVVSTYAAPAAIETGTWAYMEPVLFNGNVTLTAHGFQVERDSTYEWFGDRDHNQSYLKPDYALLVGRNDWEGHFRAFFGRIDGVESLPLLADSNGLLQRAEEPFSAFLHDRVADTDSTTGFDRFAIVKLDWDYPAYLGPLPPSESLAKTNSWLSGQRWEVEIQALPGTPSPGNGVGIAVISTEKESASLPSAIEYDGNWRVANPGGLSGHTEMQIHSGQEAWVQTILTGNNLHIDFRAGPNAGRVRVTANDLVGEIDLNSEHPRIVSAVFSTDLPEGRSTSRSEALPGQYVALRQKNESLELRYLYAQQENLPEENTRIDLINRDDQGALRVFQSIVLLCRSGIPVDLFKFRRENPDTLLEHDRVALRGDTRSYIQWLEDYHLVHPMELHRPGVLGVGQFASLESGRSAIRHIDIPLTRSFSGSLIALVRPGTRTKLGPVYPSNPVEVLDPDAIYGAVRLRLRIPDRPAGSEERLLTSGAPVDANLLYLRYAENGEVMVGLTDGNRLNLLSNPLMMDRSNEHVIDISLGAFYPSEVVPGVPDGGANLLSRLQQQFWVRADGKTILSAPYYGPVAPWKTVLAGKSSVRLFNRPDPFSGQLTEERFWPDNSKESLIGVPERMSLYGTVHLKVTFPIGHTLQSDPLVTTGEAGAGDFIYVYYVDPQHIRIGFDHWGVRGFTSKPIAIDYAEPHDFVISIGSLFPPDGDILYGDLDQRHLDAFKKRVSVTIDGNLVLDGLSKCYDSPPQYVTIGRNEIGGSTAGPVFTGEIHATNRIFNLRSQ